MRKRMLRKVINKKYTLLLTLFVFCFSSATLGGFSLYGHEVHFEDNNAHTHHVNEDHGLGESDHEDVDIILFLDYIVNSSSIFSKTHFTPNQFLHCAILTDYFHNYYTSALKTALCSNIKKFLTTDLYQLHSSYLI
ncbi:MAG: hypothetical protein ACUZ8O_02785 [Candidatus Anammoxibacter sp.]